MKIPEGKTLYPLSDAQKMLRWSEFFTIEPIKVKEINILGFYVKTPENPNSDVNEEAEALEKALNHVIRCNDSLRTRIIKTFKGLRQYISNYNYQHIERINVNGECGFEDFIKNISKHKVGWFDDSLIYAKILIMSPHQCAMILRIHHTIFDGYSIRLMFEQLKDAYNCYISGTEPKLPDKEYSITDYFKTLDKYRVSKQRKADIKYWYKAYNNQRNYSFPAGRRSEKGDCSSVENIIDHNLYQRIIVLARDFNCSLQSYMMTMAALTTYALTGKDNFCIYSLTHGRQNLNAKKTIGCMQNTVPTFYDFNANEPVSKIVSKSYMEFLEALSHGRLSMSVQTLLSYKEPLKNWLNFNHAWMLFSSMEFGELFESSTDLRLGLLPLLNLPSQFYVSMLETPKSHITFKLTYQTRKFTKTQAELILSTYVKLCKLVADNPDLTPSQLKIRLNNDGAISKKLSKRKLK